MISYIWHSNFNIIVKYNRIEAPDTEGAYSKRGPIKFRGSQIYQRKYLISLSHIKYSHLNVNQDGIKEEKA